MSLNVNNYTKLNVKSQKTLLKLKTVENTSKFEKNLEKVDETTKEQDKKEKDSTAISPIALIPAVP